jgi:hypothetical protein
LLDAQLGIPGPRARRQRLALPRPNLIRAAETWPRPARFVTASNRGIVSAEEFDGVSLDRTSSPDCL